MPDFKTITDIAREAGVTQRQADYASREYGVEATARVGTIRVFDEHAANRIKSAIRRIARDREAVHA
ncbi:MAG: hypothetical protein AAGD32_13635 [Planctomycetota bacterium]